MNDSHTRSVKSPLTGLPVAANQTLDLNPVVVRRENLDASQQAPPADEQIGDPGTKHRFEFSYRLS